MIACDITEIQSTLSSTWTHALIRNYTASPLYATIKYTYLEFLLYDGFVGGYELLLAHGHQLLMCRYMEQPPHSGNESVSESVGDIKLHI